MASRYGDIIVNKDGTVGHLNKAQQYTPDYNFIVGSSYKPITQITNADGTVGTVSYGQLVQPSSTAYKKLSKIASTKKHTIIDGGGLNNIATFITKMQDYKFAPPSDNFWSVKIEVASSLEPGSKKSIGDLYNNINAIHNSWNHKLSSKWKIDFEDNLKFKISNYLSEFTGTPQLFLAQKISFTPLSLIATNKYASNLQNHGGFLNVGNIVNARNPHGELKIDFLVSNWNIGDILFENWIGAVAKQGLIASSDLPIIKSDISVTEYAITYPHSSTTKKAKNAFYNQMHPRKQIIFYNAFPTSRSQQQKSYETNEAGAFKSSIISFAYDDYKIKYLI